MSVAAPPVRRRPPGRGKPSASRPVRPNAAKRRRGRATLRVVRPARPRRLPFLAISLFVVGLLIAAVAGVQAVIAQSSFRMDDLSRQAQQLQQRNGELRLEIAELGSPKHLERAARRMGLREPDPSGVRVLTVRNGDPNGPKDSGNSPGPAMAAGGVP